MESLLIIFIAYSVVVTVMLAVALKEWKETLNYWGETISFLEDTNKELNRLREKLANLIKIEEKEKK